MKSCMLSLGIALVVSSVVAQTETLDVQAYLPLFERNSIARKILDVNYSFSKISNIKQSDKRIPIKKDTHFVLDTDTGKYRKEEKYYDNPSDTNSYRLFVEMWDGNEFVFWDRSVSTSMGSRSLGSGVYEDSGQAVIYGRPFADEIVPSCLSFFFDGFPHTFAETVPKQNPKLGDTTGDTITIETEDNKFTFSKKTCALEKIDYLDKAKVYQTYTLSAHVECSGVWIPLRIVETWEGRDGVTQTTEFFINPTTLSLHDTAEDSSIFHETLPAGCRVSDQIRKKEYIVTTLDTNPQQDVEALQRMLDAMLDQAEEQKTAVEREKKEKK